MKKRTVFLLLVVPLLAFSQKDYAKLLDRYMQAQADVNQFSGTVLVAKKGKIVYGKSWNLASREWQIANANDSRYWIGSLTKQLTAAAILQLEEQGKLSTSDKLEKFFTGYPNGEKITLHMLLNHTSGIRECSEDPKFFGTDPNLPIEKIKDSLLATFRNKPFDFEPGTNWKYSNSGYLLLGFIIEKASGQTYYEYLEKNLLEKAGMSSSGFLRHDRIVPKLVNGYSLSPDGWKKADFHPFNIGFSAGNIYATASDLLKWRIALDGGKIIGQKSLEKMNSPHMGTFGSGYGTFVDKYFGHKALHHQGGLPGFNTYMSDFVDDGVIIIVLTNRDTDLDFTPKGLAAIMFDREVLPTYKRNPVSVKSDVLQKYEGKFEGEGLPFPLNIVSENGKLLLRLGRDIELVPESQTKFYINEPDVELQIEYVIDANQNVTKLFFIEAGVKTEVRKIG